MDVVDVLMFLNVSTLTRRKASGHTPARSEPLIHAVDVICSHQFAHAALLSHSVLTLVVEAHLAGFAAQAVLRRVPRQEHHVLGGGT